APLYEPPSPPPPPSPRRHRPAPGRRWARRGPPDPPPLDAGPPGEPGAPHEPCLPEAEPPRQPCALHEPPPPDAVPKPPARTQAPASWAASATSAKPARTGIALFMGTSLRSLRLRRVVGRGELDPLALGRLVGIERARRKRRI